MYMNCLQAEVYCFLINILCHLLHRLKLIRFLIITFKKICKTYPQSRIVLHGEFGSHSRTNYLKKRYIPQSREVFYPQSRIYYIDGLNAAFACLNYYTYIHKTCRNKTIYSKVLKSAHQYIEIIL